MATRHRTTATSSWINLSCHLIRSIYSVAFRSWIAPSTFVKNKRLSWLSKCSIFFIGNLFTSPVSHWTVKSQRFFGLYVRAVCEFMPESYVFEQALLLMSIGLSACLPARRYWWFECLWCLPDGLQGLTFIISECFCNMGWLWEKKLQ